MRAAHGGGAVEIGDGASEFENPMVTTRRQGEALGRVAHQRLRAGIDCDEFLDRAGRRRRVGGDAGKADRRIALGLDRAGGGDAARCFGRAFGRRGQDEIGRRDRGNLDLQVDPVEQRAGQARLILRRTTLHRPARASIARIERMLNLAEYKRRQAAPGVKVTLKNFGRDRRYPITNRFRDSGEAIRTSAATAVKDVEVRSEALDL